MEANSESPALDPRPHGGSQQPEFKADNKTG